MEEKKLTDEELKKAFFILRHGSSEGLSEYIKAVLAIENEYNRQKTEIERLTEENRQLVKIGNVFALERNNLREELDELKKSGNGVLLTSLYKKQADDHKRGLSVQRAYWEKKVQKAVKDTAKKCYGIFKFYRKNYYDIPMDLVARDIEERTGVEVE